MQPIPTTIASVFVAFNAEQDRFLPEGPRNLLVEGREALAWVNIQTAVDATAGDIHLRFWDNGDRCVLPQPQRPGFFVPSSVPNVIVLGREKEIGSYDLVTGDWHSWATIPDSNPRTIINDGEITPDGKAIVFGTKDLQFKDPIANLYLFTLADHRLTLLKDRQLCSNGKVLREEADGLMLYDIDTPDRRVRRYRLDMEARTLYPAGVAVDLTNTPGFPDGMVGCGDDTVIVAMYHPTSRGPGKAYRFRLTDGSIVEQWELPGSPRVTCPLVSDRLDKKQLIFTTAVEGMPTELRSACPQAGNLFIAEFAT